MDEHSRAPEPRFYVTFDSCGDDDEWTLWDSMTGEALTGTRDDTFCYEVAARLNARIERGDTVTDADIQAELR